MSRLPSFATLRGLVVGLAVLITLVITIDGVVLLFTGVGHRDSADTGNDTANGRDTFGDPGPAANGDESRGNPVPDQGLPTISPVIAGPGVRATPPRLIAVARSRVPAETLRKIAELDHVQKVAAVDGGTVRVSGADLRLLAVEPAQFRSWTPQPIAEHPEVWRALTRSELVADAAAVRRLGMALGAEYQVDGGPRLRVAASASLGFPGVDGLISQDLGRRLRFSRGVVVLVHGDAGEINHQDVERLLGPGTQIVPVGPEDAGADRTDAGDPAGEPGDVATARPALVGRPESYLELYQRAAAVCPGLSWTVLAAIGQVESGHGRNNGPSSAGALGPMQFMPATWKAYGVDGDGDGEADIWSPYDAVPSAAKYLCANGANLGGEKLRKSVWFYNHSWSYVDKVLALADAYARAYP